MRKMRKIRKIRRTLWSCAVAAVIFIAGIITGVFIREIGEKSNQQFEIPTEVGVELQTNCRQLVNDFYFLIENKSEIEDMASGCDLPKEIKLSLIQYLLCLESEAMIGVKQTHATRQLLDERKTTEGAIRADINQLDNMKKKIKWELGTIKMLFEANRFGQLPKFPKSVPSIPPQKEDDEDILPPFIPA